MRFNPRNIVVFRRRGITAVLAMMYMMLFSALALGFYASVTSAVQVASNEQRTVRALASAESGMAYIKYHLANLGIPPNTPPEQMFQKVYDQLNTNLSTYNGAMIIPGQTVTTWTGPKIWKDSGNTVMRIPGDPTGQASFATDGNASFRIVIYSEPNQQLQVKAFGNFGKSVAARGTLLQYAIAKDAAKIFNYGVASKSALTLSGNVTVEGATNSAMGSVMSATTSTNTPLTMTGNAKISGDASFVLSNPSLDIGSNCKIAGLKVGNPGFSDHIHTDIGDVPFPLIDTSLFVPYVPAKGTTGPNVIQVSNPSGTYFKNIRIKAGANPSFASGATIEGIVVVESPNDVKFSGGVTITGAIVSETNPTTDPNNASFNLATNKITFLGGVTYKPISELPENNPTDFPASMRALGGSMLLVPGFHATFGGNFGSIGGSIIASGITFNGTAGGTITGSVINLRDSQVDIGGTSVITIQSVGTSNYPPGVLFGSHYTPLPSTYAEVTQ